MPWAKFTDSLHENDKLGSVSDAAFRLWVLAITWSNEKLTDGHVPLSRPVRLMSLRNSKKTIDELLSAGLWHRAAHPCMSCMAQRASKGVLDPVPSSGYLIHDYHQFQPAAWKVKDEREKMRALGRAGGQKSGQVRSGRRGGDEPDEASRSSAALPEQADETKRHAQAPRSSATVERSGSAPRLTGTLDRHAQAQRSTPVPPYSRVLSDSSRNPPAREAEPPIPDIEPGHEDAARSGSQVRREGLHHVGAAAARIVGTAGGAG